MLRTTYTSGQDLESIEFQILRPWLRLCMKGKKTGNPLITISLVDFLKRKIRKFGSDTGKP